MLRQIRQLESRADVSLGPHDHGRTLSLHEFRSAEYAPGYVYELIDGALVVSPQPMPNHDYWVNVVVGQLRAYSKKNSKVLNYVTEGSELEIPNRPGPTRPQPDIAAFRDYPYPPPTSWDDVCPDLVVEVISQRRAEKDTLRNRHLYWQARGVREYWIIDPRANGLEPTLLVLSRTSRARSWHQQTILFGKTYSSKSFPGLRINLKLLALKKK